MTDADHMAAARARVLAARASLAAAMEDVQARLNPQTIASDVLAEVIDQGQRLAGEALIAARKRPVATGAAAIGFALLISRPPLLRLAFGLVRKLKASNAQKQHE